MAICASREPFKRIEYSDPVLPIFYSIAVAKLQFQVRLKMYYVSLRKLFVCTALSATAAMTLSSLTFGQGFSPGLPNTNSTFGSPSKPKYSLPRTTPKLDQPVSGSGSNSKSDSNFGGSNFALPRRRKSETPEIPPEANGVPPANSNFVSGDAFETLQDLDSSTSNVSDVGSISSESGRELFIDICNVKLMQDIMIPAEEEGLLSELNIKEGDAVPAGKIIGKIDAGLMELAAEEARKKLEIQRDKAESKSAYNVAVKKYKLAKDEYEMAARLGKRGSRSAQEVRRAKYSTDVSYAEVQEAMDQRSEAAGLAGLEEIKVRQIDFRISKMRITTPFDGNVLKILKHANEYVQKGENVVQFVRMDKLWVEGTVSSETCRPSDVKGKRVTVTLQQAGGEELEFLGQVVTGPLEVEGVGKRFRVRAEVNNRYENGQWVLLPGASLSMTVDLGPNTTRRAANRVR